MLDMKYIRENVSLVKENLRKRASEYNLDLLLSLDEKRRELLTEVEILKKERNDVSAIIGKYVREKKDTQELKEKMSIVSDKIKQLDDKVSIVEQEQYSLLLTIPNMLHESVIYGESEEDNVEIRKWNEPKKFDFKVKSHDELGIDLDILDFERGVKLSGSRFVVYKGLGAKLERALINFMLDLHTQEHGFKEIITPQIAKKKKKKKKKN